MDKTWEYKVITFKSEKLFGMGMPDDEAATRILNDEGSRGWELTGVVNQYGTPPRLILKRPR